MVFAIFFGFDFFCFVFFPFLNFCCWEKKISKQNFENTQLLVGAPRLATRPCSAFAMTDYEEEQEMEVEALEAIYMEDFESE